MARPGANRLRSRIVASIGQALGRPVEVGSVSLRFFPQPGFELDNFVIQEDPAYGAEPFLRAQEVTASLRITSLLRGRLEIASLSLTDPSLNLARNTDGHWNLETLVERTEKIPVAPTAKGKGEARPGFPYIEGQHARINVKIGAEKTSYALTESTFSIWQDSENTWGLRLKAQPVRTDLNLSDTGVIRVNGSFQRAASLHDTPLQFQIEWDRPQLGQLTKLISSTDKGWRGTVSLTATLNGTPGDLQVQTDMAVDDFRRYDVTGGGDLQLAAECKSHYSSFENSFDQIACSAPVGIGVVNVSGHIHSPLLSPEYDLSVIAQDLPAQSVAGLARHAKLGMPDDLAAAGQLNGKLTLQRNIRNGAPDFHWQGGGEAAGLRLSSSSSNTEVALSNVNFKMVDATLTRSRVHSDGAHIEVAPFHVVMGGTNPMSIQGSVSRTGYAFEVQGDAQLQRLFRAARLAGLPVTPANPAGTAKVDVAIAGTWKGFAATRIDGRAQLRSVETAVLGLNEKLQISSANVLLVADRVIVKDLNAHLAGATWHGTVTRPRPCVGNCPVSFDFHGDEISVQRLNQLLNPSGRTQPWYKFLTSTTATGNYMLGLNASGTITADKVALGKISGSHLAATVELNGGKVRLSGINVDLLGGHHSGEWTADFTAKPPTYSGSGKLARVLLTQLAPIVHRNWITGTADTAYRLNASGTALSEMLASGSGSATVEAHDGSLPLLISTDNSTLQIRHLSIHLSAHEGKIGIEDGKLETDAASYAVSGSVTSDGADLKLSRKDASGFNITGSLSDPRVSQIAGPATQAALKP